MTNNCQETIREMAHLIKNVSPYRLFDEVLKIMHSGYGVEGYKSLRKEKLFEHLFPFTNKILKDFSIVIIHLIKTLIIILRNHP